MANKTATTKTATKATAKAKPAKGAAAKGAKTEKAEPAAKAKPAPARGPRALLVARHGSKEALAKTLAEAVARADEDTDVIADRLRKASNRQLLRLHAVAETVKTKFGGRDKLIAAIGQAERKAKDKDYLAKLETLSLPNLLELATAAQRRARP